MRGRVGEPGTGPSARIWGLGRGDGRGAGLGDKRSEREVGRGCEVS